MPNRLADETSPYLLQHKDNPVEWHPWGEAAFRAAREQDKPIFLSVGYSACHWCHVMAHESFEDVETAGLMNEYFINIKVDREERPDVDSIYMNAVQAITGRGGWPMSVWLLPDGRPFYGGTYYPKEPGHGLPSFKQVLQRVAEIYRESRASLEQDAQHLTDAISRTIALDAPDSAAPPIDFLQAAFQDYAASYDERYGGFGGAPKFPPAMGIEFLLRLHKRFGGDHLLTIVTNTLDHMMYGGIYDQVGGGFHRYSVDAVWLVPHFEKMLYDNALLIRAYLYGYQVTGFSRYRDVVEDTITSIRREMMSSEGAFYSALDADSEGQEGKYYIWTADELRDALAGAVDSNLVLDAWGVDRGPNFEGYNILWMPDNPLTVSERRGISPDALKEALSTARSILLERRERRIKPGLDHKVLTAWNGLMITSLAQAGAALGRIDYIHMAVQATEYVLETGRVDGRLRRSLTGDVARFSAYLEDYAFLIEGLLALYQATFDLRWFREAKILTNQMIELFWDDQSGFFDTAHDHESLVYRPQDVTDGAMPSGTSGAVAVLARMAILADQPKWREYAERVVSRFASAIQQYPRAFAYLASQADFLLGEPHEVALVGELSNTAAQALLYELTRAYRPNQVLALRRPDDDEAPALIPLLSGRELVDGKPTVYVCRNFVCRLPVVTIEQLHAELDAG